MNVAAAIANGAWLAASLPEYLRFRRAASAVEATQRRLLQACLERNADTAFGREHDFAGIRSWEEFAERVPVRGYDDFSGWIDRIAQGEEAVLTAERVRLFEPSSGSSGAAKWIPYTSALQSEYRRAVAAWVAALFLSRPRLMAGRAYWSLTPQAGGHRAADSKVPVGFDEDSAYLGGAAQRLLRLSMATPATLRRVPNSEDFWRATALALLACTDLRLVSAWHPSFILLLLRYLRDNWPALLDELHTGTRIDGVSIRARPRRSRALRDLGPGDAASIWPRLGLISCWGDGHAATSLRDLQREFPAVAVQPKGLLATEGVVSFPLGDHRPLAVRSHFFEFEDARGAIHPAWDLRVGEQYSLVMTTGGGLYRYALRDAVVVDGYYRDTPSLEFVGKTDSVVDHRGEKLSEGFVVSCMNEAFDELAVEPGFAMLAPDLSGECPGYTLYIESAAALPEALRDRLEDKLCRGYHYALCIRLGQLRPLRVFRIRGPAFDTYAQALVARGMRLGDIKPMALSRYADWSERFDAYG